MWKRVKKAYSGESGWVAFALVLGAGFIVCLVAMAYWHAPDPVSDRLLPFLILPIPVAIIVPLFVDLENF